MSYKVLRVYHDEKGYRHQIEKEEERALKEGELLVRIEYSSINYKDALGVTGKGKIFRRFPIIPGIDLSGEVVDSRASEFSPGEKVLATGYDLGTEYDGGYGEYAILPSDWVLPLPQGLSTRQAMCLGTAGFTAALAIHRMETNCQYPGGGEILVTGATGGVGSLAINILSKRGYEVVALTSKVEEESYLKCLGAKEVLFFHELERGTKPLEKARWAGVIDNLGGEVLSWAIRSVKLWGNVASIGLALSADLNSSVMPMILRGVSLLGVSSANTPKEIRTLVWNELANEWAPPSIDLIVKRECVLEEIPDLCHELLSRKNVGRTLVRVG